MESFELIRSAARELHSKVVASRADPLQPNSLIVGACKELSLEFHWLDPGDPALKGGRGVFDEHSGTVCCADVADFGDRMELAAHEVAHACVHTSSSACSAEDVDASRSMEGVPIGLQRVEDYGARERRELQANVFAREFLLPRDFLRDLFLTAGKNASEIAGDLRLPLNLVRQQLFDVLLLPVSETEFEEVAQTPTPDDSQDSAAAHRNSAFQLQAGPGTGKTRTLVKRILSLLEEGVEASTILVLTFSNRAAGELTERVAAAAPDAAGQMWIGTFHAFGLDLLRRYHDRLGLPSDPVLFDRSDAIEVLEEILPLLPLVHYRNLWDPTLVLRDIVGAISKAKDELADAKRYQEVAERMHHEASDEKSREDAEKVLEIARVYKIYEEELAKRGAVDFGDLVMQPALLLEHDAEARELTRQRHQHILVDEYQDVNRASARLVKAIAGDGQRLWVVGDARQSIYRFRGASSANMGAFSTDYSDVRVEQLSINYRSSGEIVRVLVDIAPHLNASAGMLTLDFRSARGDGGVRPEIRRFGMPKQEIQGIAASVEELADAGVKYRDQAVLCRTNSKLNDIASGLQDRGIPVLHLGSFFEREEIRDLLALQSLLIDPYGDGLARVGAMTRYDLTLQDVREATQLFRQSEAAAASKLTAVLQSGVVSGGATDALNRLIADIGDQPPNLTPWEFLATYLLDRTDMLRNVALSSDVVDALRGVAIWQFVNFARDIGPGGSGLPIQRLLDRVRRLVLLAEERDLRQVPASALHIDAVRLLTVHGSKGLEFEAVHVPGLTKASFPSSYRGVRCPTPIGLVDHTGAGRTPEPDKTAHEDEEQCLFFVALSRAKTHLRLYLARRQQSGRNRNPSPFLEWMSKALVQEVSSPPTMALPADAIRTGCIKISWPTEHRVPESRLRTFDNCPRRFFYSHVLELGGKRKPTPFTKTDDCLYDLIKWIAVARRSGQADSEDVQREFERIWQEKGPADHAFANDYRALANRLVDSLMELGVDDVFEDPELLIVKLTGAAISVQPDELIRLEDGTPVLRFTRTGHKRKDEYTRTEYAIYHLAAQTQYDSGYHVEALHLADGVLDRVPQSDRRVQSARQKGEGALSEIRAGNFDPKPDAVTCPRCPHFFICGATPRGTLSLCD